MTDTRRRKVIFDLDNCIADDEWRLHMIRGESESDNFQRYREYHENCGDDVCRIPVSDDRQSTHYMIMSGEYDVVIITARPVEYSDLTEEWLLRNGIEYTHLLMRQKGDFRSSIMVKFDAIVKTNDLRVEDIELAVDDRLDILNMYSQFGIPTRHVQINQRPQHDAMPEFMRIARCRYCNGTKDFNVKLPRCACLFSLIAE
jgi:uncharacterized HAD superfamily protein